MSSPSSHHIPFPSYWLSLNARPTKVVANTPSAAKSTMPAEELNTHSFLSNKPIAPRSASVSSGSSAGSNFAPNSPPTQAADASPVMKEVVPVFHSFLPLNTKVATPRESVAVDASPGSIPRHSFLSNRS